MSGYVPPHRASDGRVFGTTGPVPVPVESLRACGIDDWAPLPGGQGQIQFAVGPDGMAQVDCLARRLGDSGRVVARAGWAG